MAIVGLSPQILEKRRRRREGEIKERRKRRMAERRERERERFFPVRRGKGEGLAVGVANVGSHFMARNYRRGWTDGVWKSEFSRGPRVFPSARS